MSDGVKSAIGGAMQAIPETVIKPVGDEIGKALEQGLNSVLGTTPTPIDPTVQAKKEQDNQVKIANIKHFFDQMVADRRALDQQNLATKQQDQAQVQVVQQQTQQVQMVQNQKQESLAAMQAKVKTEAKPGQGAGG